MVSFCHTYGYLQVFTGFKLPVWIKFSGSGEEKTDVSAFCGRKPQLQNRSIRELCFVLVGDSSIAESANFEESGLEN
jgi:hypothetical protein